MPEYFQIQLAPDKEKICILERWPNLHYLCRIKYKLCNDVRLPGGPRRKRDPSLPDPASSIIHPEKGHTQNLQPQKGIILPVNHQKAGILVSPTVVPEQKREHFTLKPNAISLPAFPPDHRTQVLSPPAAGPPVRIVMIQTVLSKRSLF